MLPSSQRRILFVAVLISCVCHCWIGRWDNLHRYKSRKFHFSFHCCKVDYDLYDWNIYNLNVVLVQTKRLEWCEMYFLWIRGASKKKKDFFFREILQKIRNYTSIAIFVGNVHTNLQKYGKLGIFSCHKVFDSRFFSSWVNSVFKTPFWREKVVQKFLKLLSFSFYAIKLAIR